MQHNITKVLIWIGFVAFLATSIPHVAFIFHSFEGSDTSSINLGPISIDKWWFLSYLEAISIDVLIAWLSHVLTSGKAVSDKGIGYTFIIILVTISWFFNWLYAKINAPVDTGIWSHSLMWGLINLRTVTPIITSALPVFAIGYSIMLSKLTNVVTADELKAQLEEKKKIADIRKQYAPDESKLVTFIKGSVTNVKGIQSHIETTFNEDVPTPENESNTSEERDTSEQTTLQTSLASGRNVSLSEASQLLHVDETSIKRLITQGKLKTPSSSTSLVTRASIESYLENRKQRKTTKLASNGHSNGDVQDTDALSLPLLTTVLDSSQE